MIRLSNELHMMDTPGMVPKIHRHEDAFVPVVQYETVFDKYASA